MPCLIAVPTKHTLPPSEPEGQKQLTSVSLHIGFISSNSARLLSHTFLARFSDVSQQVAHDEKVYFRLGTSKGDIRYRTCIAFLRNLQRIAGKVK